MSRRLEESDADVAIDVKPCLHNCTCVDAIAPAPATYAALDGTNRCVRCCCKRIGA